MLSWLRASAWMVSVAPFAAAKQPHLVFILIDDMGYEDFYNSADLAPAWPHVAAMANSSCVAIDQYYTQPICTPTRGAFMTGRHPVRLGLQHLVIQGAQRYGLPLDETTIAQKLQRAGYTTVGVGKWHLGLYNNASLPTRRGFKHWYGFWQGGETHFNHVCPPVLDLNEDEIIDRGQGGVYSADLFGTRAARYVEDHSKLEPTKPLFLYLALQNVHNPLQSNPLYESRAACVHIPNKERKIFCGMAAGADDAVRNVTTAFEKYLPGQDVVYMLSGDNGGMPNERAAGSNCPSAGEGSPRCLRGGKQMVFEGGIRNHALVCSTSLLPQERQGSVYSGGIVHVMDFHSTLLELGAYDNPPPADKPLDGMSVWQALLNDSESPRSEFLININPETAPPHITNKTTAYRFRGCIEGVCGDFKYVDTPINATWIPTPTSDQSARGPGTQNIYGRVTFDQKAPPHIPLGHVIGLYNISADPGEHHDLKESYPGVAAAIKRKIALLEESIVLQPCNLPGGSCHAEDPAGLLHVTIEKAWMPWVKDGNE